MVRHVDDGGGRGRGLVLDVDLVVVGKGVGHISLHFAGEAVVAVGGDAKEFHVLCIGLDALIDLVLPTGGTAVEAVAEVVLRELVLGTVDGDLALVDAVRIPADGGTEIGGVVLGEVVLDVVEAEDDVLHLAILVRNHDGDDAAAEVGDAHFHSLFIGQGVQGGGLAVVRALEVFGIQAGDCRFLAAARQEKDCGEEDRQLFHVLLFRIVLRKDSGNTRNIKELAGSPPQETRPVYKTNLTNRHQMDSMSMAKL